MLIFLKLQDEGGSHKEERKFGVGMRAGTAPDKEDPEQSPCVHTPYTYLTKQIFTEHLRCQVLAVEGSGHTLPAHSSRQKS